MPKHRRCIPFACIVLAFIARTPLAAESIGASSLAQQRDSSGSLKLDGRPDKLERRLDAYLSQQSREDRFSGVVLVARNGVPLFRKAYGFADRANRRPNTVTTRFNLGSLNKMFTRSAIDQLVMQGRLSHTDTLGAILPDFPEPISHPATVMQLLNMTAGLTDLHGPEFTQQPKDRFRSNADFYAFASTLPPLFPPGTRMQHCNGCYIALGAMIERITQRSYEDYMSEHVFGPAGMSHTASLQADDIERNLAIGYTKATGELRSNVFLHGAAGSAAGGGYSTADDLLSFLNASRNGRLPSIPPVVRATGDNLGVSTAIQTDDTWTVIVLANMDPPAAPMLAATILDGLTQSR
jgi:CubicO group peptidase (beta-lactamase class C family)